MPMKHTCRKRKPRYWPGCRGSSGEPGAAVDILQSDRQAEAHQEPHQAPHSLHGTQHGRTKNITR
jgi:hypothetical protein